MNLKSNLIKQLMELEAAETPGKISQPEEVLPFVEEYRLKEQEHFIVLNLDGSHKVINTNLITKGIVNKTLAPAREVFRQAILDNSVSIILVHNHPSGESDPSNEDFSLTDNLKQAGKILGIPVLDHIIIAKTGYYSFQKESKI